MNVADELLLRYLKRLAVRELTKTELNNNLSRLYPPAVRNSAFRKGIFKKLISERLAEPINKQGRVAAIYHMTDKGKRFLAECTEEHRLENCKDLIMS